MKCRNSGPPSPAVYQIDKIYENIAQHLIDVHQWINGETVIKEVLALLHSLTVFGG